MPSCPCAGVRHVYLNISQEGRDDIDDLREAGACLSFFALFSLSLFSFFVFSPTVLVSFYSLLSQYCNYLLPFFLFSLFTNVLFIYIYMYTYIYIYLYFMYIYMCRFCERSQALLTRVPIYHCLPSVTFGRKVAPLRPSGFQACCR